MMDQSAADIRVTLRDIHENDLPVLFEFHRDKDAGYMAAFTAKDPEDHNAFMQHWHEIMAIKTNPLQIILADDQVAGYIVSFEMEGQREVGYWLGKAYWGKGIATQALRQFLKVVTTRPLHAHAAKDNAASLRVLQKCGFSIVGEGSGFSNARQQDVEEYILRLE